MLELSVRQHVWVVCGIFLFPALYRVRCCGAFELGDCLPAQKLLVNSWPEAALARNHSSQTIPVVAQTRVRLNQNVVLLLGPFVLLDVGIYLIVPTLPDLLASAAGNVNLENLARETQLVRSRERNIETHIQTQRDTRGDTYRHIETHIETHRDT